jgi:hypothetical protein
MPDKECRDCGKTKDSKEFWKRKSSPDGLALYCKDCFSRRNRASYERRVREERGEIPRANAMTSDAPDGLKHCPGCSRQLPLEDFVRNRTSRDGVGAYCRPCSTRKARESRERVHGSTRHYHLTRRYGLSAAEVAEMVSGQFGVCPICIRSGPVHVDHDHATGRVRAVLCFNCNGGLGQFRDDPELLRRAARYLEGEVWRPIPTAPGVFRLPS